MNYIQNLQDSKDNLPEEDPHPANFSITKRLMPVKDLPNEMRILRKDRYTNKQIKKEFKKLIFN